MASIRKRFLKNKKVAWQVDYKDLKGKRRHKQFPTKAKADDWLVRARGEIAEGTHVAGRDSITFKEAGEAWIKNCKRRRLEETTILSYEQHLRDHVYPLWGSMKLSDLTTVSAQTFYENLLEGDRTVDMVRRVRIDTGAVVNYAKSKGWVGKNVIYETDFEYSTRKESRPDMPTVEEGQRIIVETAANWKDWLAFILLLIFCGLRASEIRAVTWADFDFARSTLRISRRADRWGRIGSPKSSAGTRTIPFGINVRQALLEWRPRCPRSNMGLVFPTSKGTVQGYSNIMTRFFRPMLIEAGICKQTEPDDKPKAKFSLHHLRHFCASLWIDANFSPKRVQTYMGHASIKQTFDTYGYLFELRDTDQEALYRIETRILENLNQEDSASD